MKIVTAPPKSSQIAKFFRDRILSGKLPGGSRLDTVRRIAENFSVSRQVVETSYDFLEKENLIQRNGRRGIYVKSTHYPVNATGIYFLAYDVYPDNHYLHELFKITCPPYLKDNCTFLTRVIPRDISSDAMLDAEISRISDTHGIECVLVACSTADRKIVQKLLQLPYPVIFIGDFKVKNFSNIEYNQIVDDNRAFALNCTGHLINSGHKSIVMFIGNLKHYFNAEFLDEARQRARNAGVKIIVEEFPSGMKGRNHSAFYSEKIEKLLNAGTEFDAVMLAGTPQEDILDILKQRGLNVPSDISVFSTSGKEGKTLTCGSNDLSVFFDAIYQRIEELRKEKNTYTQLKIKAPFKITDKGSVADRRKK
ncbi:MAG: hypothetical protein A2017_01690 [Lentisphaerae bacterium GWF2_44_16]|nr:MAG: hypothetical protein A2017_01690 [Lentisphaerae bacterium GWF2_44_16]